MLAPETRPAVIEVMSRKSGAATLASLAAGVLFLALAGLSGAMAVWAMWSGGATVSATLLFLGAAGLFVVLAFVSLGLAVQKGGTAAVLRPQGIVLPQGREALTFYRAWARDKPEPLLIAWPSVTWIERRSHRHVVFYALYVVPGAPSAAGWIVLELAQTGLDAPRFEARMDEMLAANGLVMRPERPAFWTRYLRDAEACWAVGARA